MAAAVVPNRLLYRSLQQRAVQGEARNRERHGSDRYRHKIGLRVVQGKLSTLRPLPGFQMANALSSRFRTAMPSAFSPDDFALGLTILSGTEFAHVGSTGVVENGDMGWPRPRCRQFRRGGEAPSSMTAAVCSRCQFQRQRHAQVVVQVAFGRWHRHGCAGRRDFLIVVLPLEPVIAATGLS